MSGQHVRGRDVFLLIPMGALVCAAGLVVVIIWMNRWSEPPQAVPQNRPATDVAAAGPGGADEVGGDGGTGEVGGALELASEDRDLPGLIAESAARYAATLAADPAELEAVIRGSLGPGCEVVGPEGLEALIELAVYNMPQHFAALPPEERENLRTRHGPHYGKGLPPERWAEPPGG